MRKFTFTLVALFLAISLSAVDIIEHFNLSSTGKYKPYTNNGTVQLHFDFEVTGGPINQHFTIGFYLSTDLIINTSDLLIDTFGINSCNNGSSAFPSNFGTPSPYKIEQMLLLPGVPHNTTFFLGCILDYKNEIAEDDENNNSGYIQMPPFQITGNVGNISIVVSQKTVLNIYPNPVMDKAVMNLTGDSGDNLSLEIMDITGKIVFIEKNIGFPYVWSRGDLQNGLYLVILRKNDKAILRKKLVLK